ncbi:ead/Ea22-like family protein, partial [Escherichia coli]|nr:ead/Ea22-like family protein [Escherichia coli]MCN3636644.1 ead/Ea22-like family protein [Escherichia coli]
MSKIDYQGLREKAEKATWGDWDSYKPHRGARGYEVRLSSQAIAQHVLKNNAEFIAAFNPKIALALLDERERNQQYIKSRDQENEEIALTVGKLRVELEAEEKTSAARLEALDRTHKMFQREQCRAEAAEKRIAELEKSEEQLINERDHAESALADMYFAATGDRPEWSNWFGFSDAVDAVVDRIADLEAKQPSPVVPEGLIKAVRFYEQVKRENPPVETGAWKDAVDWVLKEAC